MTMTKAEMKIRLERRAAAHQARVEKAMAEPGARHRLRPVPSAYRLSGLSGSIQGPEHCGSPMKLYDEDETTRVWICSACQGRLLKDKRPYGQRPKSTYMSPALGRGQTGHQRDQGSWHGR